MLFALGPTLPWMVFFFRKTEENSNKKKILDFIRAKIECAIIDKTINGLT